MANIRTPTGQRSDTPSDEQLVVWVHFALRHLYEPSLLRASPLIPRLDLAGQANPTAELRQLLGREVRSMAPPVDAPADSELRRIYEVLLYRYIQHDSQVEVADQLGISTRQLRRVEHKALQALAARLHPMVSARQPAAGTLTPGEGTQDADGDLDAVDDELAWLKQLGSRGRVNSSEVLPSVLDLVRLLAERYGVHVQVAGSRDGLPPVVAHPVALKQILLNLLTVAIRVTEGRNIIVSVTSTGTGAGNAPVLSTPTGAYVVLRIEGAGLRPDPEHSEEHTANIDMARRLAESCGARVEVHQTPEGFVAVAAFRSLEEWPVVVIDDNLDTIRLLQRYATGTPYRIHGARNLAQALALAGKMQLRAIVLDVMMPEMDGWEVLGQLRQHPLTTHIPIVICTILSQQELALSLGATGFIRKPISRHGFLDALDQLGPLQAARVN